MAFAKEEAHKWPSDGYSKSFQSLGSTLVGRDIRFRVLTIWSKPTPAKPVPDTVVNLFLEVWLSEVGPELIGRCTWLANTRDVLYRRLSVALSLVCCVASTLVLPWFVPESSTVLVVSGCLHCAVVGVPFS